MRYISEIPGGWWVRWTRRGEILLCKSFAFSNYGGKQQALKAARLWRDEQLKSGLDVRSAGSWVAEALKGKYYTDRSSICPYTKTSGVSVCLLGEGGPSIRVSWQEDDGFGGRRQRTRSRRFEWPDLESAVRWGKSLRDQKLKENCSGPVGGK